MNHANLDNTLKQLRPSGLAQTLFTRMQETAGNRLHHAEFMELKRRQRRQLARRAQAADFRTLKLLDGFDNCGQHHDSNQTKI